MTDTKFNTLYPQREHAPGPGSLSPAAQAVLDAAYAGNAEGDVIGAAVAALRAAADQVVPDDPEEAMHFTTEAIRLNRMSVRANLLAIAVELEGCQ